MSKLLPENFRYRSHPWHGLTLGENAPQVVNCYVEIVPTDTVKYELDKETGLLKIDRPQKYSSLCPCLYGFLPQTYAGEKVAEHCMEKSGLKGIKGDGDPLDICILTENVIPRGDIILKACPIGGFRFIDKDEADDKIIAVMVGDFMYEEIQEIEDCPRKIIERLRHYFLTYKDSPERKDAKVSIVDIYDSQEAQEIIRKSQEDYAVWLKEHQCFSSRG